ncbi:hypothetical protein [Nonomuraea rubra]|uniref:Uncharacterized protein n=1 Tax=Nonomuraea rubra TaxID=46180 RepID=A0A7X0NWJ5_9ACTN|nr:hypothetical protein [Nonomuraea rubra]MBB6550882.1 hypothetical protein [Nonomuraea rubra]
MAMADRVEVGDLGDAPVGGLGHGGELRAGDGVAVDASKVVARCMSLTEVIAARAADTASRKLNSSP